MAYSAVVYAAGGPYTPNQTLDPSCVPTDNTCYVVSSGGGTWGQITGVLSNQTDLQTVLGGKFNAPSGTTSQYVRGNGSITTLDTSVVPENGNLYFTNARAIAAPLTGFSSAPGTVTSLDTTVSALGKLSGNIDAKLTSTLADSRIFVGNGSAVATAVALSGDATISNTGVLTLATTGVTAGSVGSGTAVPVITFDSKGRATSVTTANILLQNIGGALSTTQQNAISFGNISGTVNLSTQIASTLGVSHGGTGNITFTSNALLIGNGTGALGQVIPGTDGQVLSLSGGVPTYVNPLAAFTIQNGLTGTNPGTVELGGTLAHNTNLALGGYTFGINGTGTANISANTAVNLTSSGGAIGFNTSVPSVTIANNGDLAFFTYPQSRNDSGTTTPVNFLYTDNGGNVLSGTKTSFIAGGLGFTPGSVVFANASGGLTQANSGLFFNGSSNRLGIGTATPAQALDVSGNVQFSGALMPGGSAGAAPSGSAYNVLVSAGTGVTPTWTSFNFNNIADTRIAAARGSSSGTGIVELDNTGVVPLNEIPSSVFNNTFVRPSFSGTGGCTSLTHPPANQGDICEDTSTNTNYVLTSNTPSNTGDWIALLTPAPPVSSVNGAVGNVTLTASNGLTYDSNTDLQLGGTLGQDTEIDQSGNYISFPGTGGFGIGTTSGNVPSQALQVVGNFELDGAFMPNGNAGTSGKVLQSTGPGSSPIWVTPPTRASGSTLGDMEYWNGSSWITFGIGTNGQKLSVVGGTPAWSSEGQIVSLNGLTGTAQTLAVGSSGSDFNISSSGTTHTFNIPTASATARGLLSSADWTTFNGKGAIGGAVSGGTATQVLYTDNSGNLTSDANFTRDSSTGDTNVVLDTGGGVLGGLYLTTSLANIGVPFMGIIHGTVSLNSNSDNAIMGVLDDSSGTVGFNDPNAIIIQSNNSTGASAGFIAGANLGAASMQANGSTGNARASISATGYGAVNLNTSDGGEIRMANQSGDLFFNLVLNSNPFLSFGDLGSGNGTNFTLNDTSKNIAVGLNSFDGNFFIQNQSLNKLFAASPNNGHPNITIGAEGFGNNTNISVNDANKKVYIAGGTYSSYINPTPVFSGSGVNDLSLLASYHGGGSATYTITIDNLAQTVLYAGSGMWNHMPFNIGDTVTGTSSGATAIVKSFSNENGTVAIVVGSLSGSFTLSETITDSASGASLPSIFMASIDTYTWVNGATTVTDIPMQFGGTLSDGLGVKIGFGIGIGHTVGDSWTLAFVSTNAISHMAVFDANSGLYRIGDLDGAYNKSSLTVDDVSQTISANVNNGFYVSSADSGDVWFDVNPNSYFATIGDINNAHNRTYLSVNDGTQSLVFQAGDKMVFQNNFGAPLLSVNAGTNAITFNGAYTFPSGSGSANEVLMSNGSGSLLWTPVVIGSTNSLGSETWLGANAGGGSGSTTSTVFIGDNAGINAGNASYSVFLGKNAGSGASGANDSIFIGNGAGQSDTVNDSSGGTSILIGENTSTGARPNSIALGTGATNTASNQFMVGSSGTPITSMVITGASGQTCLLQPGTGVSCTSDQTLKTNIVDIPGDTLDTLSQLRTVTYNWISDPNGAQMIGFLAQDMQLHYPELVTTDPNGKLAVNYASVTPLLVEAIRELGLKVAPMMDLTTTDNSFVGQLITWLGNSANGIFNLYAKTFIGSEADLNSLCMTDSSGAKTCITKSQLDQIIQNQNNGTVGGSGSGTTGGNSTGSVTTTGTTTGTTGGDVSSSTGVDAGGSTTSTSTTGTPPDTTGTTTGTTGGDATTTTGTTTGTTGGDVSSSTGVDAGGSTTSTATTGTPQ
jgi:hypothetical protein